MPGTSPVRELQSSRGVADGERVPGINACQAPDMHKLQTQQYGNITKDISIIETKISQLSAQITQMETRFGKMMEHDFENRDRRIDEINAELSRLREQIINIAREDRYAFMKKQYKLYLVESFVCLFAIFCQNRRLHPESPETAAAGARPKKHRTRTRPAESGGRGNRS